MRAALCLLLTLTLAGCASAGAALPIALKALDGLNALAEELSRPSCDERPVAPLTARDGGASDAGDAGVPDGD